MVSLMMVGIRTSMALLPLVLCVGCAGGNQAPMPAEPQPSEGTETQEAWSSARTAELLATCNRAYDSVDEAGIKACFGENYLSELADDVFERPPIKGPAAHLQDAKERVLLFEGLPSIELTIASPTLAAEVFFHRYTIKESSPVAGASGKTVVSRWAKFSRVGKNGQIESDIWFIDSAAFGKQTGLWNSPFPSATIEQWPEPIAVLQTGGSGESVNLEVVRNASRAFHTGDIDVMVGFYAEQSTAWEPMGTGTFSSRADLKKQVEGFRNQRFKETSETVVSEFAAGDWVARLIRQRVVLSDNPPTYPQIAGKIVETTNLELARLKDGLIVETYSFYNPLSIQTQLGLFDPTDAKKLVDEATEALEKATN